MPQITGHIPNVPVDVTQLNLPEHIQLADPNFYQPCEVDLLLGAEVFYELMSPKQIKSRPGMPILQESKLGWIVVGPLTLNNCNLKHNGTQNKIHCNFTKEIHENLTKFWALEEVQSIKQPLCANDEFCEQHFTNTTKRLDNGRFSVLMPLCEDPETSLGDSYKMAEKRFINLEKKFKKCPDLKQQYTNFIKEYEDLGHLTKIERPTFGYMMPHHAVIRESSETSRLRVVFDASAKSSSNKSLNDIQCIGPVVQDDLFSILVRFRQHKYVLSGDITKMYRQISMDESQRHLQLILWRDDDSRPLDTLQLNTVTYGTASAPYLSTRCLVQLAKECRDPVISEVIQKDFYVDDLLTGASTEHEPTFGGLWEAGVKSAKHHLKRIIGNASLTFEELSTLFTQIEAILNSRPLIPLSPDPNDLSPLTPGHFLIGRPLTSLPEPPCENMKIRTRYQLIEQYRQSFWSRWSKEYLAETQQRTKCRLKHENLKPGDMVVFKELNLPPMKWKLARVQHMYPGSDGVCRVADFITYRGVERRALNKVCPLPVTADDEDDAETLKEISTSSFQGGQNVNADGNIL
ncbi:unnamed protein product [Plutella xylostella]|uniref:(diamondback moth) hypothetical protein n=1 Tax=Plutella xylostella TaxID=51655 RepID=A0A8S4GD13_PLUXY|nr:unnamed protein product [Plutella xylostella]